MLSLADKAYLFGVVGLLLWLELLRSCDRYLDGIGFAWKSIAVLRRHARELEDAERETAEALASLSRTIDDALSQIQARREKCDCDNCQAVREARKGN